MGLFGALRRALIGGPADADPDVARELAQREARHRANDFDARRDIGVALMLADRGRIEDAAADLQQLLSAVTTSVALQFPQCTPKERRGMVAMARHSIFGAFASAWASRPSHALACRAIAHAWWICALALQGERGEELRRASARAGWEKALAPAPPDLLDWLVDYGKPKHENQVDQLAADVWARLGLRDADRPRN